MDLTAITSAVDFAAVVTGIIAIGALLMAPNVAKAAVRKILSMVR